VPARYHVPAGATGRLRVSIVTPVLDQAPFIEATMQSVLSQAYPALEYLVLDGGSTDGTKELVEAHAASLACHRSAPDGGQAQAINAGMRLATGDVLGWLNGDDLLLPGAVEYVAHFFESHPGVDVVYGHRVVIDGEGREIGRWVLPPHDSAVLSWADFVPQETLFWRRSAWSRVGGQLDESYRFAMDWDLLVRMRDAGMRFHRLPRFLGAFRWHPAQKTQAEMDRAGLPEMDRIRLRSLARVPSQAELRLRVAPYVLRHAFFHRLNQLLDWY
jgi:glycosyltransferase involved in cell wall biosynthesis